jgi:2-iminobutanoate/2-iminopropanoate deaminase
MTLKRCSLCILLVIPFFIGWTLARQSQEGQVPGNLPFSLSRHAGQTLHLSGSIGRTHDGKDVRDSVAAETRQIMENIGLTLKENGYTYDDIVSATVYLRDLKDYAEMNAEYAKYFPNGFPARTTIGGVDIVFDYRVEITCVAFKK